MADIASKISTEVLDKYTVDRDTQSFSLVAKDNPKDRILRNEFGWFIKGTQTPEGAGFKKGHLPWNKDLTGYSTSWEGQHHSEESKAKMRLAKLGRKMPEEQKKKISNKLKGRMPKNLYLLDNSGANSHWWKGGITPENEHQRKTKEFRNWRKAIYERDGFRCWKCKQNTHNLHPHHIFNFSEWPQLRFEVDNGATLCELHHREFHRKYSLYKNNDNQLREYLWQ